MPPFCRLMSITGEAPTWMICTSSGAMFHLRSISSSARWPEEPKVVMPTRLPFKPPGVVISGLTITR